MGSVTLPSVHRALDILELFLRDNEPRSVPEITKELGIPRSTSHELVKALAARGYLAASRTAPHHYSPGLQLLALGELYTSSIDVAEIGRQIAEQVGEVAEETVHVGVLDGSDIVYVAKQNSKQAVRMVSRIGGRVPAHCTAGGKVLLAYLTPQEVRECLHDGELLQPMTSHSVTSMSALLDELTQIRSEGVGYDYCESTPDAACVAVPVRGRAGQVVAAISMSVPLMRWSEELLPGRRALILEAAAEFSRRLGYVLSSTAS